MFKLVVRRESTIKLQLKLTKRIKTLAIRTRTLIFKSRAFCRSVFFSSFSKLSSSRKVGLSGFNVLAVPGVLSALFKGDARVRGGCAAWRDGSLSATYPKPTSDTCGCGAFSDEGSAKGEWPATGEMTVVSSAKRAVRGLFSDECDDEPEERRTIGAGCVCEWFDMLELLRSLPRRSAGSAGWWLRGLLCRLLSPNADIWICEALSGFDIGSQLASSRSFTQDSQRSAVDSVDLMDRLESRFLDMSFWICALCILR